jgi:DNA-binding NarL/FixJ family response regulator
VVGDEHARRVLIGGFSAIAGLGLREFLVEFGFDMVAEREEVEALVAAVSELRPHSILLDLDAESSLELAERVSRGFPHVKVILCSSEAPVMRVFPAFGFGQSHLAALTPASLVAEMKA